MRKRLTAILVAVVFVLGTAFVPSQIYAAEPVDQEAVGTEAVEPEAVTDENNNADEMSGDEDANSGPDATEPEAASETVEEETPAEEDAENAESDMTDLVVVTDENGDSIDLEELDEDEYDGFLYKIKDDTTNAEIKEMEESIDDLDKDQEVEEVIEEEIYASDSIETIEEVAEPEQIEYIEPNYIRTTCEAPNDPYYNNYPWQMEMTNIPYVWDRGMTGAGAVVAVLDSGVNTNHKDFAGVSFVNKYNVTNGTTNVTDKFGHGTAVAGIIAEARNNGIGYAGAMSKSKIMPVKVTYDNGKTNDLLLIQGMSYAVCNNADVINLSIGSYKYSQSLKQACDLVTDEGIIIVAAAGNEGNKTIDGYGFNPVEYPAAYDCVVSVGSVNSNREHSTWSTYNDKLTVVAPGENVWVLNGTIDYYRASGTSFSTPQVTALAAMMKSRDHSLSPATFMQVLRNTSTDLGAAGRDDYYGYGLINYANVFNYMATKFSNYSLSLSATVVDYDGTAKSPSAIVSLGTVKLTNGTDYAVSYESGRKAVGKYKVTVTGKNGYSGTKTTTFTVRPPLVKPLKAVKRQKKKLTVSWKAMSKKQKKKYKKVITGYQVRVSTDPNFSSYGYVKIKGIAKTKVTIKGLKKKTTYYVKYRSYKTVGGTTYYSKWSAVKTAKTK